MMARLALALCVLLTWAVVSHAQTFSGVWVDNDGRFINICVTNDGTRIQGNYNEVGFIQGRLTDDGQRAEGILYQAIHPADGCNTRLFEWELLDDGEFDGQWRCEDLDFDGGWHGTKTSSVEPSSFDCAVLSEEGSLEAVWRYRTTDVYTQDICIDDDDNDFTSSYENSNVIGGSFGESFLDGRILSGTYQETDGAVRHDGWDIYGLLEDGSLLQYRWDSEVDDEDVLNPSASSLHDVLVADVQTANSVNARCQRNLDMIVDEYLTTNEDAPTPPSPAVTPVTPISVGPTPPSPPPLSPDATVPTVSTVPVASEQPSSEFYPSFSPVPSFFPPAPVFFSSVPTFDWNGPQAPGVYGSTNPTSSNTPSTRPSSSPLGYFHDKSSIGGLVAYRSGKTFSPPPVILPASYAPIYGTSFSFPLVSVPPAPPGPSLPSPPSPPSVPSLTPEPPAPTLPPAPPTPSV